MAEVIHLSHRVLPQRGFCNHFNLALSLPPFLVLEFIVANQTFHSSQRAPQPNKVLASILAENLRIPPQEGVDFRCPKR